MMFFTVASLRDRLPQTLMELGRLTSDHIKKAEALQLIHGGALDTAILELGVLEESAVLEALARARDAPAVDALALREIPPEVLRLVPAKAAHRLRAVPFRAAGASAHLAVLDAGDLAAQDELSFVVGRRVRLFVTTEVRLIEALAKHYGGALLPRFRSLLERLPAPVIAAVPAPPEEFEILDDGTPAFAPRPGEAQERWRRAGSSEAAPRETASTPVVEDHDPPPPPIQSIQESPAAAAAARPSVRPSPPAVPAPPTPVPAAQSAPKPPPRPAWVVPLSEAERARLKPAAADSLAAASGQGAASSQRAASSQGAASSPAAAASARPAAPAFAPRERRGPPSGSVRVPASTPRPNPVARERDAIAERLLREVLPDVDRALLLRVRGGKAEGWRGMGVGVDPRRLQQFSAEIDGASIFSDLVRGSRFFVGSPPPSPVNRRLAEVWGVGESAGCAVLPLRLRNRLGALLYLDRLARPISASELARWEVLCERAAADLEACVLRGKHRQS